jgi:hypothetical protein
MLIREMNGEDKLVIQEYFFVITRLFLILYSPKQIHNSFIYENYVITDQEYNHS